MPEVWEEGSLYEKGYFSFGFKASDYFYFGNENVSNTFYFILVREAKKHFSGILGLSIFKNEKMNKYNLMGQLKYFNVIHNKTFYFNFEDNLLIIDDYPHYTYGKKYLEQNFRKYYIDTNEQNFDIMFSNIAFNNGKFN